jgi:hypothetical protein
VHGAYCAKYPNDSISVFDFESVCREVFPRLNERPLKSLRPKRPLGGSREQRNSVRPAFPRHYDGISEADEEDAPARIKEEPDFVVYEDEDANDNPAGTGVRRGEQGEAIMSIEQDGRRKVLNGSRKKAAADVLR